MSKGGARRGPRPVPLSAGTTRADIDAIVTRLAETRMDGVGYTRARLQAPFCVAGVSGPVTLCYLVRRGPVWLELDAGPRTLLELETGAVVGVSAVTPHWFKGSARTPRQHARPIECEAITGPSTATADVELVVGAAPIESLSITFGRTGVVVIRASEAPTTHRRIWNAWAAVEDELSDPAPAGGATAVIRRQSEIIQLNFVRHVVMLDAAPDQRPPRSRTELALMRAIAAAAAGSIAPLTVEALAKHSGMSRSSFFQHFRELTGQSPVDAITGMRIRKAAADLVHTRRTLADIAESAGYGSVPAFTRAFVRHIGATPARWRRQRAQDG